MKVMYSEWIQSLDRVAIETIQIPSIVLMENASQGAARFFSETFPPDSYPQVIILVGKGNNGGDGIAAGRILHQMGHTVTFLLLGEPEKLKTDPRINYRIIEHLDLPRFTLQNVSKLKQVLRAHSPDRTFIVDAIFGTGLNQPVKPGIYQEVIHTVNTSSFPVAAIDIPSGLSEKFIPDGKNHIIADCTATFQHLKVSHLVPDGNLYCGKIRIVDIGIPRSLLDDTTHYVNLIQPEDFNPLFAPRRIDAHKGDFGHCLTIAGSREKPGAGILSSISALKSGAGLCTAAVPEENRKINIQSFPELMELTYSSVPGLLKRIDAFTTLMVGPGLGINPDTRQIVEEILQNARVPVILDADGLNVLAGHLSRLSSSRNYPLILTPHPGEFSRLVECPVREIMADRIQNARNFARTYRLYLVLKGHHTIIACPDGSIYLNQTGNPGLATAGSGDVLSGIIGGLTAQFIHHHPLKTILQGAVFIHGYAADLAIRDIPPASLTASDLIHYLPRAIGRIHEFTSPF